MGYILVHVNFTGGACLEVSDLFPAFSNDASDVKGGEIAFFVHGFSCTGAGVGGGLRRSASAGSTGDGC